jgi:hypothetical protein
VLSASSDQLRGKSRVEGGGSMEVGGHLTFSLELEDTQLVNQPEEEAVFWTKLALLAATLAVNIAAVVILWQKDDTPINRLIISDCLINIMTMFITIIPHHNLNNAYLCSIHVFSTMTLSLWNRVVPVGIAVIRYVLVCITLQCCVHN